MQAKHQFGWGDTYGIRKAITEVAPWLSINTLPIETFGYPKHEGDEELVSLVRKLLRKLTGKNYQHILITQGCTHALNAYVAVEKKLDRNNWGEFTLSTNKLYFPFYPGIAENHDLSFSPGQLGEISNSIQIIDSPSNPEGKICFEDYGNAIWDAAYYSPTYGVNINLPRDLCTPIPNHVAMAGSLSKFTGINGIRVGWLATNDQELYDEAAKWVTYDICGVSGPSQWIAKEILKKIDLEEFWNVSRNVLDSNRTEVQKLSHIFGDQNIPTTGMFALFEIDNKLGKLLEKASVQVTPGSNCGDDRNSVRINLAHTNEATRAMVKAVLKVDKIK